MGWLRRLLIAVVVLGVIGAGAYWWEVLDGSVPATSAYKTDIAAWRALIASDSAQLPNEIRVEIVGRDTVPLAAMQAGATRAEYPRVRAAFQLNGPTGTTVIDSTFDKAIAAKSQREPGAQFDQEAYDRVISTMGAAAHVMVTHEHADHIGGVARFPMPERLAERLILTREQYAGMASATVDGKVPPDYAHTQIDLKVPTRVAPGVVMIPAPGHSPGSVLFFVKVADGHEYLFLGDVVWVLSNITDLSMRPRFTEQFFMKGENRTQVADQVRALHDLSVAEPTLRMIPAHDGPLIAAAIASGAFKENFFVDGP